MRVATPTKSAPSPKSNKTSINRFHQRLAQLTVYQATQMLGVEGNRLLSQGGVVEIDPKKDVYLVGDLLRIKVPESKGNKVNVTITLQSARDNQLLINCD